MNRQTETLLKRYLRKNKRLDYCEDYAIKFLKSSGLEINKESVEEIGEYIRPYLLIRFFKQ
jgi:hypothetical protein